MRKLTLLLSCVLFALSAQGLRPQEPSPKPDIFYLPTPQRVVDVMLLMAEVKKDDMLYDLGSGDGRLVITAAKRYGARGIGIEIDPRLLTVATRNAFRAKVEDKAQFREADLFTSDFKDATGDHALPARHAERATASADFRAGETGHAHRLARVSDGRLDP
jgi:16S rRNA G966 N2-methylase RsmD